MPDQSPALHWRMASVESASQPPVRTRAASLQALPGNAARDSKRSAFAPELRDQLFSETIADASSRNELESRQIMSALESKPMNGNGLDAGPAKTAGHHGNGLDVSANNAVDVLSGNGRTRAESEVDELAQLIKLAHEEHQNAQLLLGSEPFDSVDCAFPDSEELSDDRTGFILGSQSLGSTSDFPLLTEKHAASSAGAFGPSRLKRPLTGATEADQYRVITGASERTGSGPWPSAHEPGSGNVAHSKADHRSTTTAAGETVGWRHQDILGVTKLGTSPQNPLSNSNDYDRDHSWMQMKSPEIQDSLSLEKRIQSQQAVQMEHSETASGPRQKIRPSSKHHSVPTCSDAAHSASDATGPDEHVLRKRETHNLHTRVSRQKISHCFERLVAVLTAGCALEESDLIVCNELDGACIPEHRTVCACCGLDHCARKECLMCKTSSNGATTASKSDGTEGCQANPTFDGHVDSVAPKRDHQSRLNEPGTCCGWRDRAVARRQRASALRQRLRHRAETLQYATQTIIELRRERRLLELHLLMASETFRKSWMREVVRQIADRDQVIVDAGNMLAECCKPVIRAVLEHFQWPFAELWVVRTRPATVEKALHAEWYTSDAMHVWLSHEATLIVPLPLTILENEDSLSLSTTPQAAERVETSERLKLAAVPNEVPYPDQTDLLGTRSPRVEAMQPAPSDPCMDVSRCSLVRENSSDAGTKTQLSQSFIECKSQEEQDAATLLVRELEQFALESKRQTPDTVLDIQHRALECKRPVGVRIRSGQVVAFDPETDSECDGVPFARLALAQKHGLRCLVAIPVKQRTNPANDKRMRASAFGSPESSIQSVIVVGTVVVDASLRPLMGAVEALLQCLFDELMTYI